MGKIILSQNFNGWCSVSDLSFSQKIKIYADYVERKYGKLNDIYAIANRSLLRERMESIFMSLKMHFLDMMWCPT